MYLLPQIHKILYNISGCQLYQTVVRLQKSHWSFWIVILKGFCKKAVPIQQFGMIL